MGKKRKQKHESESVPDSTATRRTPDGRYVVVGVDWFAATSGPDGLEDAEHTLGTFDTEETARAFAREAAETPHEGADPELADRVVLKDRGTGQTLEVAKRPAGRPK